MRRPAQHKTVQPAYRRQFLRHLKDAIRGIVPDAEIILYGSRARGDATDASDWDLVILTDAPVTYQLERLIRQRMDDLSLETDVVISAFVHNRQEWMSPCAQASPYHRNVMRDGVWV